MIKMKAGILKLETVWDDVLMKDYWAAVLYFEKKPNLDFSKDVEVKQK